MMAAPTRIPPHHVPNILPASHKRDDYDFDYKDGVWGPIRLSAYNNCLVPIDLPALVWCRRHGWEKEIIPDGDVFEVTDPRAREGWGWRCPTCGRARVDARFTSRGSAERSLSAHLADKHNGIVPYRLHGEARPWSTAEVAMHGIVTPGRHRAEVVIPAQRVGGEDA